MRRIQGILFVCSLLLIPYHSCGIIQEQESPAPGSSPTPNAPPASSLTPVPTPSLTSTPDQTPAVTPDPAPSPTQVATPSPTPTSIPSPTPLQDADGDGYEAGPDCNDSNSTVYPGAIELCGDGVSQNCLDPDVSCLESSLSLNNASAVLVGGDAEDAAGHRVITANVTSCDDGGPESLIIPAEKAGAGKIYVVPFPLPPGEHGMKDLSHAILLGDVEDSWTGNQLATGDLDGDGCQDLVVSAPYDDPLMGGLVYIVYGPLPRGEVLLASCEQCATLDAETSTGLFGNALTIVDLNHDGFSDVVASAWHDDMGRVYFYYGRSARLNGHLPAEKSADAVISGQESGDWFGYRLASVGDTNGDDIQDLIVTSPAHDEGTGSAYLFYGNTQPWSGQHWAAKAQIIIEGEFPEDLFGSGLSAAGDVNDDGNADFLIGASYHDANGPASGKAYLFLGRSDSGTASAGLADWSIEGLEAGQELGYNLGDIGDWNGDGIDDFAIGLPYTNVGEGATAIGLAGQTQLFFGQGSWSTEEKEAPSLGLATILGNRYEGWSGYAITGATDANGDGARDLILSAPSASMVASEPGRVYVLFGDR